jgi:hypothetical protein
MYFLGLSVCGYITLVSRSYPPIIQKVLSCTILSLILVFILTLNGLFERYDLITFVRPGGIFIVISLYDNPVCY